MRKLRLAADGRLGLLRHLNAREQFATGLMPLVESLEDEFLTDVRQAGIDRFYLVGGFDPITRAAFSSLCPGAANGVFRNRR